MKASKHPVIWNVTGLPFDSFHLLAIPKPIGGVLVMSTNSIIACNQNIKYQLALNLFVPQNQPTSYTSDLSDVFISLDTARFTLLSKNRFIASLKGGELYIFYISAQGEIVQKINMSKGSASVISSCICTIGENYFFLGSRIGDSVLVSYKERIEQQQNDIDDEPNTKLQKINDGSAKNSLHLTDSQTGESEFDLDKDIEEFYSKKQKKEQKKDYIFNKVDSLINIGPIGDFCFGACSDRKRGEFSQTEKLLTHDPEEIIACTGHGKNGAISILQRGVRPSVTISFELANCQSIWTLFPYDHLTDDDATQQLGKRTRDDIENQNNSSQPVNKKDHSIVIVSTTSSTLVLTTVKDELVEITGDDQLAFFVDSRTMNAGNICNNKYLIQIGEHSVLLLTSPYALIDKVSFTEEIIDSIICDPYILLYFGPSEPFTFLFISDQQKIIKQQLDFSIHDDMDNNSSSSIISYCLYKDNLLSIPLCISKPTLDENNQNNSTETNDSSLHNNNSVPIKNENQISSVPLSIPIKEENNHQIVQNNSNSLDKKDDKKSNSDDSDDSDDEFALFYGDSNSNHLNVSSSTLNNSTEQQQTINEIVSGVGTSENTIGSPMSDISSDSDDDDLDDDLYMDSKQDEEKPTIKNEKDTLINQDNNNTTNNSTNSSNQDFIFKQQNMNVNNNNNNQFNSSIISNTLPKFYCVLTRKSGALEIHVLHNQNNQKLTSELYFTSLRFSRGIPLLNNDLLKLQSSINNNDLKSSTNNLKSSQILSSSTSGTTTTSTTSEKQSSSSRIITEIKISLLGSSNSMPYLFAFTDYGDLYIYSSFHYNNEIRFKRFHHKLIRPFHILTTNPKENEKLSDHIRDPRGNQRLYDFKQGNKKGIFIAGINPHWIFSERNYLRIFPMTSEHFVDCYADFNTEFCPDGFIYCVKNHVNICRLSPIISYEHHWALRKIPLKQGTTHYTPHYICYHPPTRSFIIAVSYLELSTDPEINKPDQSGGLPRFNKKFSLFLLDLSNGIKVVNHFPLDENEHVICISTVDLLVKEMGAEKAKSKSLISVGTAFIYGEDDTCKGRVFIFDIIKQRSDDNSISLRIKHLLDKTEKGPISAVNSVMGYLVLAMGPKLYIHSFENGKELIGKAFFDTKMFVVSIKTLKHYIIVADMYNSVYFLIWKRLVRELSPLGKDCARLQLTEAEFLIENDKLGIFISDRSKNVQVMSFDPNDINSGAGGKRLIPTCEYHLGDIVIKARKTRIFSNDGIRYGIVYVTTSGSIGIIGTINEDDYNCLLTLQAKMLYGIPHPAGLNPKGFRKYAPKVKQLRPRNNILLDIDLLLRYNSLGSGFQREFANLVKSTPEKILKSLDLINVAGTIC